MFKYLDYNNIYTFDTSGNKNSIERSLSFANDDFESNFGKNDCENVFNDNIIKLDCLQEQNLNNFFNSYNENKITYLLDYKLRYFIHDKQPIFHKKEKIFNIFKTNKKIGRIKKDSSLIGKHNRLSEDNIIRKIKGRFIEKVRLYINKEYKNYLLNKNTKRNKFNNFLKKINPKVSREIKKEENLKWFETKIYTVFSQNVSLKYSSYSPDSNKRKIERLISLNEAKSVIEILNMDIQTLFNKYINDEMNPGSKTLKDDLKELESQMKNENKENIKEYLKQYEYIAKNMKKIFIRKSKRSKKVEK